MRRSGKYEVCELAGNPKLECIWEARAELGESAIWVDDEQALYFVDGPEGRLLRYSESDGASEVYRHDGVIGCIAQRVGGVFMAGMDKRRCKLDTLLASALGGA